MKKRFFTILVFLLAHNLLLNHAQAVTTTAHDCDATDLPESALTIDAGADTHKIQLNNCTGKELGDNPGKNFYWQSFTADPASNPPDDIGVEVDIDGTPLVGNSEVLGTTHALTDGLVTIKNTNAQQVEVRVYVYSSDTDYANNSATYKITMAAAGTGSGGGDGGGGAAATPVPALPMFGLLTLGGLLGFLGLRRLRQ